MKEKAKWSYKWVKLEEVLVAANQKRKQCRGVELTQEAQIQVEKLLTTI